MQIASRGLGALLLNDISKMGLGIFFLLLQEMERINLKGTDFSTMMHSDMLSKTVLGFIMLSKYFSTFPLSFCCFFFFQIDLTSFFYFGNHKFWLELIYVRSMLFLCLLAKIKLCNGPIKLSHYYIGMFILLLGLFSLLT